jgi:uncharacterized membrane protein
MTQLIVAALAFVLGHVLISSSPLRPWLVARLGERTYLRLFTAVMAAALIWLIWAYGQAPYVELWPFHPHGAMLTVVLMLPAMFLAVTGVASPNPTAAGVPSSVLSADAAKGIFRITRHPFMWGVGLWAIAHLVPNGDVASLILFGSLAILALVGTRLIDRKFATNRPEVWPAFAAVTSNLPFAAIVGGRQRLSLAEIGWWRLGLAVVVWALVLWLHPWLFGVDPLAAF